LGESVALDWLGIWDWWLLTPPPPPSGPVLMVVLLLPFCSEEIVLAKFLVAPEIEINRPAIRR